MSILGPKADLQIAEARDFAERAYKEALRHNAAEEALLKDILNALILGRAR